MKGIINMVSITHKNVSFSVALEYVKKGYKISLDRWFGEFVVYQKGYPEGIKCNKQTAEAWGLNEGDLFICNPYLQKQNKDGSHTMWTPSTDELLSDNWSVFEFVDESEVI